MVKSEFVDSLAAELQPIRRRRPTASGLAWVAISWSGVLLWMVVSGDARPGLAEQFQVPRFAAEFLLGCAASTITLLVALQACVPGRLPARSALAIAFGSFALWSGAIALGIVSPVIEPSMLGKRDGCSLETLLLSLGPLAVGLGLTARLAPLSRPAVGACLGLAAGGVPALLMQLFCMYEPWHALTHHLLPIVPVIAAGALSARFVLPRY